MSAPVGVWLIARSPFARPYPCRCAPGCGSRGPAVDSTHVRPTRASTAAHQYVPRPDEVPSPAEMWIDHSAEPTAGHYRNPGAQVSPARRRRLYDRDGNRCVRCGTADDLTLDHIHPRVLGGRGSDDNLRTLCRFCNSSKGGRVE